MRVKILTLSIALMFYHYREFSLCHLDTKYEVDNVL